MRARTVSLAPQMRRAVARLVAWRAAEVLGGNGLIIACPPIAGAILLNGTDLEPTSAPASERAGRVLPFCFLHKCARSRAATCQFQDRTFSSSSNPSTGHASFPGSFRERSRSL